MKHLISALLLVGLLLSVSSAHRDEELFQVISSHPHDLAEISPYIETVHQDGRLWLVRPKDDAPAEVFEHLRMASGREKSYLHSGKRLTKVSKNLLTRNPIRELVMDIDAKAIKKDVEGLSSYKTRATGTRENQQALAAVGNRLKNMGYEVQEICYRAGACSLIADKLGSTSPENVLMVMGHIDSVGADFAGADDNASGTAVLLEMARVIKDYQSKKTIRFFVTNGEELGLLGAKHYAKYLDEQNKIDELELVINMDMVGYNSNGIVELETNREYEAMAQWFSNLAAEYTTLKTKITLGAWGSDHVPFLEKGVPSLLTIEDWNTKTPCYHKACDKPETLNYHYAASIGMLNLSAILHKDIQ